MSNKILIIGGVAGGATTAARLRRLDEFAEIVLFERGEYISFANCGLPYHIGGVIEDRELLVVQTVEDMQMKFNIDVRVFSEVVKIDSMSKKVLVKELNTGNTYYETYDKVVLSTGSQPVKPPIAGITEANNLFTLRNMPDMDKIIEFIKSNKPKRATVIGGGFIGIEMMENLAHLKMDVTLIEMAPQVMGMFDYEMAQIIHQTISNHGVRLILNDGVKAFKSNGRQIELNSGTVVDSDLIIFAIGVKPDNTLAKEAGLELTNRGAIKVNEYMITSNPDIYAIGDVVEVNHLVSNKQMLAALAGPANRQGRIVANHLCGIKESYQGTLATSVAKVFDLTVGSTGLPEKTLIDLKYSYESIYIHPSSHASYYPGYAAISMKVLYDPKSEMIYGVQAIGKDGVDKRIDVMAMAIYVKMKITDLKNIDFAYAPPFSSAKDPINMIGYVAENKIKGLSEGVSWKEIQSLAATGAYLLDIREHSEVSSNYIQGSIHIPLTELRSRLTELPKNEIIYVYCQVGTRGYTAERILKQHGFKVKNLEGGFKSFSCVFDPKGSLVCFYPVNDLGDPVK
ncbi:MAG: FAD-dependent oxidoreductase [Acholeplasma sp.]|nr:FAD-dependent oxidoreductase [Acholeplasma sp.]